VFRFRSTFGVVIAPLLMVLCAGMSSAQSAPQQTSQAQPAPASSSSPNQPTPGSVTKDSSGPTPAQTQAPRTAATATPKHFLVSGTARAFEFVRQNGTQNAANPNREAFNVGGIFHAEYRALTSPVVVGASYYGSYPFGVNGANPGFNTHVDNTLPGFSQSVLGEAYIRYRDKRFDASVGDETVNWTWAPASDSRIRPTAFQVADFNYNVSPTVTFGVSRATAFLSRTSSTFQRNTLLTNSFPGATGNARIDTSGFIREHVDAKLGAQTTASVENYTFYDIANLTYGTIRVGLQPKAYYAPYIAGQYVAEHNTGRSVLGKIDNNTIGVQIGTSSARNLAFSFGMDSAPVLYRSVNATSAANAARGIFLPAGGTSGAALNAPGQFLVPYGGIASPYSDSYATDPLYTTSITQGAADRRSPGLSFKAAITLQTNNKQLRATFSEAYYDYSNILGINRTFEKNADVTYFFNKIRPGSYKGLSVRERFADRTQPTLPYDFKYIRSQLQFDF